MGEYQFQGIVYSSVAYMSMRTGPPKLFLELVHPLTLHRKRYSNPKNSLLGYIGGKPNHKLVGGLDVETTDESMFSFKGHQDHLFFRYWMGVLYLEVSLITQHVI